MLTAAPPAASRTRHRTRLAGTVYFVVPALVLAASYLWLVYDHGTLLLWNVVVHESGRYTFG